MGWNNQAVTLLVVTVLPDGSMSGIFGYSPAPGPGNLLFALTATPGTDQYGNAFEAVLDIGSGNFQVDAAGNMLMFNPTGNALMQIIPTKSVMIIYDDDDPVQGSILLAFSGAVYTDDVGNTIGQGLTIGATDDIPTTNPGTGSILLYCDASGNLKALTQNGNTRTIATA